MKIYHYTNLDDWSEIKSGEDYGKDPGLIPLRRIGKHGETWKNSATFCLLEPEPEQWKNNENFTDIWNKFKRNTGRLLLEIEVDENDETIKVVDWANIESALNRGEDQKKAYDKYWDSKVTLKEYLKNKNKLNFSLPEILITEHVPMEKISVSNEQPRIKEVLEEEGKYAERFIDNIKRVPELATWLKNYQTEKENRKELANKMKLR